MGQDDGPRIGLICEPPIPDFGLAAVLANWTGRGSLYEALSVTADDLGRRWSANDIRARAERILLARLEPLLLRLPIRSSQWLDYLPASRHHRRAVAPMPFSGVSWTETHRRSGWPPTQFIGREVERSSDMAVVQVLRWTVERLSQIWSRVGRNNPDANFAFERQIQAATRLLELDPVAGAMGGLPARSDLTALARAGAPWGAVAAVAHELVAAEHSLEHLVYAVLMPDEAIRWRLFHLAVLGAVLHALHAYDCRVTSVRPLNASSTTPNFKVVTKNGEAFDLWFEASGIWRHLSRSSPFKEATASMKDAARANGADILLLSETKALILECKYSDNADRVARDGYYQAMAYAAEISSRICERVTSVVVGPEGVVPAMAFTQLNVGRVGVMPPSGLRELIGGLLAEH